MNIFVLKFFAIVIFKILCKNILIQGAPHLCVKLLFEKNLLLFCVKFLSTFSKDKNSGHNFGTPCIKLTYKNLFFTQNLLKIL